MSQPDLDAVARRSSSLAGSLAAICHVMAVTFGSDPDTADIGLAVEGLAKLAETIEHELLDALETAD